MRYIDKQIDTEGIETVYFGKTAERSLLITGLVGLPFFATLGFSNFVPWTLMLLTWYYQFGVYRVQLKVVGNSFVICRPFEDETPIRSGKLVIRETREEDDEAPHSMIISYSLVISSLNDKDFTLLYGSQAYLTSVQEELISFFTSSTQQCSPKNRSIAS